jgi:hypothetical protein
MIMKQSDTYLFCVITPNEKHFKHYADENICLIESLKSAFGINLEFIQISRSDQVRGLNTIIGFTILEYNNYIINEQPIVSLIRQRLRTKDNIKF